MLLDFCRLLMKRIHCKFVGHVLGYRCLKCCTFQAVVLAFLCRRQGLGWYEGKPWRLPKYPSCIESLDSATVMYSYSRRSRTSHHTLKYM